MKLRTICGLLFTVLWTIGAVLLWFQLQTGDVRVGQLGEYIAGGVAPLALLWFVLAYYQQSEELRASTEALQKQQVETTLQDGASRNFLDTYKGYTLSPGRNMFVKLSVPFEVGM